MFGSSALFGMGDHHFYSKPAVYGGMSGEDVKIVRRQRQRMNFVAVFQSLFVPWILFCLVFGVTAFHLHYSKPTLCWLLVGLAVAFVCGICVAAGPAFKAKLKHDDTMEPTWLIFMFFTTATAVVLGAVFGSMIYTSFTE